MKRYLLLFAALLVYLASGVHIIPANEQAVVRRFGRVIQSPLSSGLHVDLPWPLARIDRVNFNEIRTLSLGDLEADSSFLQPTSAARPLSYLTGDKNLLLLRITVQYRISRDQVGEWLYGSISPLERLQGLVETTVADLVSRSGVDFVHTQGLAELNNRLLRDVREQADAQRIGCEVEQVTVDRADPPARVKADFLDVSNARADMSRSIQDARTYAEQKLAESQADAGRSIDAAERDSRSKVSAAKGSADRFTTLIGQIRRDAQTSDRTYADARQLTVNRLTIESLRDALSKSKLKVVLDGKRPVDLTLPKQ